MTTAYFTGAYPQKIDGKGRMSIPADFRRVLEQGDPAWTPDRNPNLRLMFPKRLTNRLEVWTVRAFDAVSERIAGMRPDTPEKVRTVDALRRLHFSFSAIMEVDRDGRVVMPLAHRERLGLAEGGEVTFAGLGDRFEIWAAATYASTVDADLDAFLAEQGEDFDPTAALWSL